MLSNAYFLAKFRFDTAENEPAKNLQKFAKFANFANFADPNPLTGALLGAERLGALHARAGGPPAGRPGLGRPVRGADRRLRPRDPRRRGTLFET